MAAHLHRYKTELNGIGLILSDLRTHRRDMTHIPTHEDDEPVCSEPSLTVDHEAQRIERLASHLRAISNFCDELEKKVQNILALLFNQIQAVNDRTLQAILNASQQENRVTHELSIASHMLSQSMERDSIAMKTIAIMTLVFLPGATFAAVFAMPFFTETAYLTAPSQAWIWVILTVMCTVFAFAGYLYVVNRGDKKAGDPEIDLGQSSSSSAKSADGGSVKAT
ncbi:unnamed protein product [Fusarium equiseti]|uniref:Uncharacterized protein n=1 Tax=Fusarium equiseti TaxID=61235 RepID=A0A8J2NPW4_FUSEQ|nr:unnamed protein product [Fusarium equiseti]